MRVITGKYKGRKLVGSKDNSIRPTTNKIKEYIFNILQDYCQNKSVADIFSGSGNLGIESLSREAKHVVFVDNSNISINVLNNNLKDINIEQSCFEIVCNDAIKYFYQPGTSFDLIFMDPPFHYPPLNDLLLAIFNGRKLNKNGILVVEHEISNPVNCDTGLFEIFKQKKIGRSLISFIINGRSESA